jgi:hypothetical protein
MRIITFILPLPRPDCDFSFAHCMFIKTRIEEEEEEEEKGSGILNKFFSQLTIESNRNIQQKRVQQQRCFTTENRRRGHGCRCLTQPPFVSYLSTIF